MSDPLHRVYIVYLATRHKQCFLPKRMVTDDHLLAALPVTVININAGNHFAKNRGGNMLVARGRASLTTIWLAPTHHIYLPAAPTCSTV